MVDTRKFVASRIIFYRQNPFPKVCHLLEVKKEKKEDKPKEIPYVLSGMVRNEQTIIGQGSIFNVPSGSGRVIAFTFDPLHRYLNHHDAPLVWNVLINWDHLKAK